MASGQRDHPVGLCVYEVYTLFPEDFGIQSSLAVDALVL